MLPAELLLLRWAGHILQCVPCPILIQCYSSRRGTEGRSEQERLDDHHRAASLHTTAATTTTRARAQVVAEQWACATVLQQQQCGGEARPVQKIVLLQRRQALFRVADPLQKWVQVVLPRKKSLAYVSSSKQAVACIRYYIFSVVRRRSLDQLFSTLQFFSNIWIFTFTVFPLFPCCMIRTQHSVQSMRTNAVQKVAQLFLLIMLTFSALHRVAYFRVPTS